MSALLFPDEFDNESIESFWTINAFGRDGTYEERSDGTFELISGYSDNTYFYSSANRGDSGIQLYQPVETSQDFDVVVKAYKVGSWPGTDCQGGLVFRNSDDTAGKFAAMVWCGYSQCVRFFYRDGGGNGQSGTSTTYTNSDIYMRLRRVGNTIYSYYSSDGSSWNTPPSPNSRSYIDMQGAGYVGIYAGDNYGNVTSGLRYYWFRNNGVTYKFAGTISHDGDVVVITNDPLEFGTSNGVIRQSKSAGSWEIYTTFSGICSVIGVRDSDGKVVGFGGLYPVYHSGP